ncbi:J domain-containing protein [Bacteroidia bacterium]|nr:J domain-containing protein [Bacteroidia bacterium]MDB9881768.1 J domain-containing protein [Bacteroidia bacterium]MDC1395534.1 J domain-containing protein [Bacteroidia bacterium]
MRKAYIRQIKLYHPDLNSTVEADEISKRLNLAKEALESAERKASYDRRLRSFIQNPSVQQTYTPKNQQHQKSSIQKTRQERSRRNMERNRVNQLREYEKWLARYPMPLWYFLFGIVGALFLFIFYQVLFRGTTGEWVIMSGIVLFMYYYITIWATSEYSKCIHYLVTQKNANIDLDRASSRFLRSVFWGGCITVVILKLLLRYT